MANPSVPGTIDEYIAAFSPEVQRILKRIRLTIRAAVPGAQERISYRMPAFFQDGVVVYFAAFKKHIGVYPPVRGDTQLAKVLTQYRGEKGNLKFPLDKPIPYNLIKKVAKFRVKEQQEKARSRRKAR